MTVLSPYTSFIQRDNAQDHIKGLAPWIKDKQIGYDKERNPLGFSRFHTSFRFFIGSVGQRLFYLHNW